MCQCNTFGDYVEIWYDEAPSFDAGYPTIDRHADVELRRCQSCGAYWQVDVGRGGLAIRVREPEAWDRYDDRPVRLRQMIDHHGGLDEAKCAWAGCGEQPLRGMKFCPHHAYPMLSSEIDKE